MINRGKKPAIVLAHGLVHPLGAAADALLKQPYFKGVPEFLRQNGFRVLEPKVSSMGHVEERAVQLKESIAKWDERENDERVVIIGHSLGGLDGRYLISNLNGEELVSSLVTIGTPHHGCCVADFFVHEVPLIQLERLGLSLKALECLTTQFMKEFNSSTLDSKDVSYFSVSGRKGDKVSDYSLTLRPSHPYVMAKEGPNDGMVSVESSKWGTHLGVFPLDHLEQITLDVEGTQQMYKTILPSTILDDTDEESSSHFDGLEMSC